jgi:ABC-type amino acid transport substrate-binding protein
MSTEIKLGTVQKGLSGKGLEIKLSEANSYPDVLMSIRNGGKQAVFGPRYTVEPKLEGLTRTEGAAAKADYCILAWTDNAKTISMMNVRIAEMKKTGRIDELAERWGLEQAKDVR